MPSKVTIIVIEFMLLGINIFWALLRAHFNPHLTARAKMSLSRAQNIFMPANINPIVLLNSVIAKYRDLSVSRRSIICLSLRLRQIIDLLAAEKSRYFMETRSGQNCRTRQFFSHRYTF